MASFGARTRFATMLAVGLALVASGVVAGAAGGNFILGVANSAGTSNTSLTTSSTGNALLVTQNGSGTAIRGSTGSGSGIAGFFTSGSGSGVSGVVAAASKYGVYAGNDSASTSTGAALRANGKQNKGAIITSDNSTAIVANANGCTGFLCGSAGIQAKGVGFAAGVVGDGTGSIAGVWANEGVLASVYATQTVEDTNGVYVDSALGSAVEGYGEGGTTIDDCTDFWCAGGVFSGDNGILATTPTAGGYALYGEDATGTDAAWALRASGDGYISGDLIVGGTCTGCTAATLAVNGSSSALRQGDAVTLRGVQTAPDGSIVLVVEAAKKGDAVFGIVDRGVSLSGMTVTTKASERVVSRQGKGEVDLRTPARELAAQGRKWLDGGTTVAADGYLRIVTSGVYAVDAAIDAAVGDTLAVGERAGKLGKAATDTKSGIAGKFLGKLKDGRSVLLVATG